MNHTKSRKKINRVVHRVHQVRSVLFSLAVRWIMADVLHRISRKNIAHRYRQIAVFAFDHISNEVILDGVYERENLDLFFDWINNLSIDIKNYRAIDVGANIGNHAIYFAGKFSEVIAFEPNQRVFKLLEINSSMVNNIKCFNFGLSNYDRFMELSVDVENMGAANVQGKGIQSGDMIALHSLDSVPGLTNIRLLKIDVEGHEAEVIEGAHKLLLKERPIILLEQRKQDFIKNTSSALTFLRSYGYCRFGIIKKLPKVDGRFYNKYIWGPLRILLMGRSLQIEVIDDVPPGDYSFIIALPDWIVLK